MLPMPASARAEGWPKGAYRGEYRLVRDGKTVARVTREIEF